MPVESYRENPGQVISNLWIPRQSIIYYLLWNCHNYWTSDDIDMKLGPVTEINKENKTKLKKFYDDVI